MKGTVSGFTPSTGPNPDSIQVARAGTPVQKNSSNRAQTVCLGGSFLESASSFPISFHNKVIVKKNGEFCPELAKLTVRQQLLEWTLAGGVSMSKVDDLLKRLKPVHTNTDCGNGMMWYSTQ